MRPRIVAALFVVFAVAASSARLLAESDQLVIDNRVEYGRDQRPPVRFPHGRHMAGDIACLDCHHDYQKGKNALDESLLTDAHLDRIRCARCHGKKSGNRYGLRDAFHLACAGCHRKLGQEGKKTGPRGCGNCHPWKPRGADRSAP